MATAAAALAVLAIVPLILYLQRRSERALQALSENEARLLEAVKLVGLGLWEWDVDSDRCSYCSEENARIHGYSVAGYIKHASKINGPFAMVHPEDRVAVKALFRRLRQGEAFDQCYRILRPDGSVRHVREVARPDIGSSGKVEREFGMIFDDTERIEAEERLHHAEKLSSIGDLTGGIAHDFNNILAIVIGNLDIAAGNPEATGAKEEISVATAAAVRGAELTHQLLAFARRQPLAARSLDLGQLLEETVILLRGSLGERIEILLSLPAGLWPCFADPGELQNVLINLALNARDAMPDGGRLEIGAANRTVEPDDDDAGAKPFIAITVSDNGSGMSGQVLKRAFDPFFTTKREGRGTGLGLSMAHGFVLQSGGSIDISSREGRGTSVTFLLPRAEEESARSGVARSIAPVSSGAEDIVLLVEDDNDLRALIARQLRSLGYRVLSTADATTALAALAERPEIACLLTDLILPGGLSGQDIARLASRRRPGLPVLYISGYPTETLGKLQAAGAGAPRLLQKPFRKEQLAHALAAVLKG